MLKNVDEINVDEIKKIYSSIKNEIENRLNEFNELWNKGNDKKIFAELIFCILTPQSKAKICWSAVENLMKKSLIDIDKEEILRELNGVRFKYKKAEYIYKAIKFFNNEGKIIIKPLIKKFENVYKAREWFVCNIKGLGYKEASHFLRNIGMGEKIAILDRHILKNLKILKVIDEIPKCLSKKRYIDIENKMRRFAEEINI
ncbi:MAG TPA: N-glycosylase/DNA lyase, partial [Thermoplasmata archaeon]|nr:N-glycosylase/DNA lyase [Thermoplasmata archaeon]